VKGLARFEAPAADNRLAEWTGQAAKCGKMADWRRMPCNAVTCRVRQRTSAKRKCRNRGVSGSSMAASGRAPSSDLRTRPRLFISAGYIYTPNNRRRGP